MNLSASFPEGHLKLKVKAGEARSFLKCLSFILEVTYPPTTPHGILRKRCVQNFAWMYDELAAWSGIDSAVSAVSYGNRALMTYAELSDEAEVKFGPKHVAWKLYPKLHLLQHVLEDQIGISGNPRESWCYPDESEIGAASSVAESCHASTIQVTVIEKYRLSCT